MPNNTFQKDIWKAKTPIW